MFHSKRNSRAAIVVLGCVLGGLLILLTTQGKRAQRQLDTPVLFWSSSAPFTADPLKYDLAAPHLMFRSIMSSVITQYKSGEYTGVLAESWIASRDFQQWRFKLRGSLLFENGDLITPEVIVKSWTRMAFFQKMSHSESGFLEHLLGYEQITSPSSAIEGLRIENNELILLFKKPLPKLLDTISFGLYAVVHPRDYNATTGLWNNPKIFTSSGAYRIKHWDNDTLSLELRKNFLPDLRHGKPIQEVKFTWRPEDRAVADIVAGHSNEVDLKNKNFHGSVSSYAAYVFCQSWSDPHSSCFNINDRRALRHAFYQALRKQGVFPKLSFFPLAISGIKESEELPTTGRVSSKAPLRFNRSRYQNPLFLAYNTAMKSAGDALQLTVEETQLSVEQIFREAEPHLAHYALDVSMRFTGILVDDPFADIRFMFFSKEGIRLPDVDGSITKELKKSSFDPQHVNQLLWDQAVIWPIDHFAYGLWANEHFDFGLINLVLPPTELHWIGWN